MTLDVAKEIGSEFELDPSRLAERDRPGAAGPSVTPWLAPAVRRLASGRDALRWLLRDLPERTRLVLPAYLCESVEQAAGGREVRYCPVAPTLAPLPSALEALLHEAPSQTVLVRAQVFARPWGEELERCVERAEEAGCVVIDDRTHTWLSAPPRAERSFASVRKWMPLPDGALALGGGGPLHPPDEALAQRRVSALCAKHRWLHTGEGDKAAFRAALAVCEEELAASSQVRAMSRVGERLLASADLAGLARRRRANYAQLRAAILGSPAILDHLEPLEDALAIGAVPLGLPVLVRERDRLRSWLCARGVYPAVHWPLPVAVATGDFPTARRRAEELMTLVIDQRYGAPEMERIATLLLEYANS